ncbi:hypothetical protein MPSEU_000756100 [Mayamaea pseudoterrestris]|nr:hypothetical protein MPSEU_000756100 [Mayamaea pseudoterrestris]
MMTDSLRIRLPGSFVVLQGVPGDGRANTIDQLPELPALGIINATDASETMQEEVQQQRHDTSSDVTAGGNQMETNDVQNNVSDEPNQDFIVIQDDRFFDASSRSQPPPNGEQQQGGAANMSESWIHTSDDDEPPAEISTESTSSPPIRASNATAMEEIEASQSSFPLHDDDKNAIDAWQSDRREHEMHHRQEWLQSARLHQRNQAAPLTTLPSAFSNLFADDDLWWQCPNSHQLAVFANVPSLHDKSMVSSLAPGSIVIGTNLVTLDSETLRPVQVDSLPDSTSTDPSRRSFPSGRLGWTQVLRIESPCTGYIVLNHNGYSMAMAGLPVQYCRPKLWQWIVTCSGGAVVRDGLDLSSPQTVLLPYGTIVQVTRKVINTMGLSRLQVKVISNDDNGDAGGSSASPSKLGLPTTIYPTFPFAHNNSINNKTSHDMPTIEGWCSEYLNPLSGQRGPILQPLPFPCPVKYRIVLEQGAVLRSGVELSSPQIGHVPFGAIVTIVSRKYSDHPTDRCIERLQLAGNGGWMSCRLNKRPPEDLVVVEIVGVDNEFDPEHAGEYHLREMRRVQQEQNRQVGLTASSVSPIAATTSMDLDTENDQVDTTASKSPRTVYSAAATLRTSGAADGARDNRCLICLNDDRSATLVHGETGHIACCLQCARILKARSDPCPVCRLPIDLVVQHFWA